MVRAILFDLDHTLYDYQACHGVSLPRTLRSVAKEGGWAPAAVERAYECARQRVHADLAGQGSSHSRLLYFQKTIEALAGQTLPGLTLRAEADYWETFLQTMRPTPGSVAFLEAVRAQTVKTAIVTNLTAQIQLRKIERLGLSDLIDTVVTSEEAGVEKPAPAIFQLALEKLGVTAPDAWYVGDDEAADIRGAEAAGLVAYYLHRDRPERAETRWVTDFSALHQALFVSA